MHKVGIPSPIEKTRDQICEHCEGNKNRAKIKKPKTKEHCQPKHPLDKTDETAIPTLKGKRGKMKRTLETWTSRD